MLGIFCPEQGQGFKPSAAHPHPNIGRVTPAPRRIKFETVRIHDVFGLLPSKNFTTMATDVTTYPHLL